MKELLLLLLLRVEQQAGLPLGCSAAARCSQTAQELQVLLLLLLWELTLGQGCLVAPG